MADPIRIANCSGFYGDRISGAAEMVEGGPIDVLTGDWLAELTMLILARARAGRPGGGYARTFLTQVEQVLGPCLDRGIRIVSNAGGLDPAGCAEAVAEIADRLGLSCSIAHVEGDDLLPRAADLVASGELVPFEADVDLGDPAAYLSANAYLGCWGIVDALDRGAQVVVTGRVTDAAVVAGPAAWHHGWARTDLDALAGAVVAGHLIECSAQVTGGNYSFFAEVPGMERVGFPWADVEADGSCTIGKHDGTGGQVSVGTVTTQLLYEIGGARYLGPDVTARFDTLELTQTGPDRVRVSGARGELPPPTLKVATNELGGYRNEVSVALTGLDIEAKAAVASAAFWRACPHGPDDFTSVTERVERTEHADPATNEAATATWRVIVKDPDEAKVGRAFSNAATETVLASIPGLYSPGGSPKPASPYGVYRPGLVPAELVPQLVTVRDADGTATTCQVDSTFPAPDLVVAPIEPGSGSDGRPFAGGLPDGPTRDVPLGTLVGTRSGDKGGHANLGVFVRDPAAWPWLESFLTVDRVRELLPEAAHLPIDRYEFPNLCALNFLIRGFLQEGVAASTRLDAQAKSLGEWLRARVVPVPESLLD